MSLLDPPSFLAECPVHGPQHFPRCEPCMWWHCPVLGCASVIPDKKVTPDGAEVVQWWFGPTACVRSLTHKEN